MTEQTERDGRLIAAGYQQALKAVADLIEVRRIAPGAKQSFFSDQDLADMREGKMLGVSDRLLSQQFC